MSSHGRRAGVLFEIQHRVEFDTTTALYELATPKTPLEVREEVEAMIAAGEVVTVIQQAIATFTS